MSSAASQLDSRIEIVTPENIAFQYRLAGPFRRLPAYLLDFLLRAIILAATVALVFAVGLMGIGMGVGLAGFNLGGALIFVCWFVLSWFYGGLFETFWNGQTPGKRIMKLRVVTAEGQPITGLQAVLRNVLRTVDAFPLVPLPWADNLTPVLPVYLLGLVACAVSNRFQRLGDLACGTIVIVEETHRLHGLAQVNDVAAIELARSLPANCALDRSLGRALAAYVERRRVFAAARRAEIARTLGEPLVARYGLPPDTNHDLLLMALYHRAFISDRVGRDNEPIAVRAVRTDLQSVPQRAESQAVAPAGGVRR